MAQSKGEADSLIRVYGDFVFNNKNSTAARLFIKVLTKLIVCVKLVVKDCKICCQITCDIVLPVFEIDANYMVVDAERIKAVERFKNRIKLF
ncbi:MAG: hypothetical protein IJ299_01810 [Oscillospiraceae bacterium]|nr:hypothetical protein [Oscillospiraceae bacterium]